VVKVQIAEKHPSGAKQAAEKLGILGGIGAKCPSVPKAIVDSVGFMWGLKPPLPSGSRFFAACKARLSPQTAIPRDFVGVYPCKG
jgi:hypothetical protein